jgi:hypothetical protein
MQRMAGAGQRRSGQVRGFGHGAHHGRGKHACHGGRTNPAAGIATEAAAAGKPLCGAARAASELGSFLGVPEQRDKRCPV